MKKLILPFAFVSLLIQSSCVTTDREVGNSSNADKLFTPKPEASRSRMTSNTVLRTVQAQHAFSDTRSKDNFVLLLQGTKVSEANARFLIISAKGDTLRNEVMPASALIDERDLQNDPQASSVRAREIAILQGMNKFFAPDKFTSPAIEKKATNAPEGSDPEGWNAVRADNRAVGFDYTDASGREKRIAFAKKLNKAVVVAE
ncbi:hypothetical protein F0P96_03675 [Hymenobacter busanensis]|uniref:Uncharacterized protein n=1 Tax=Hymenobacter busanensis TaxID=2607656 RepID=A0A7L4ZYJ2_9BACT|nr:hypothetical protein [Hymenobacter busanensis]KAA9339726.1 hypothetical protein F0P96_03675 [Hymenobacter busanensis]QHJ06520.1 hypothetical protein GUY19_04075 [Hymenobacter busanensis]